MKYSLLFAVLLFQSFAQANVLAVLEAWDGQEAFIVSNYEQPDVQFSLVALGQLHVEVDGQAYKIQEDGSYKLFDILCEPYADHFPYGKAHVSTSSSGFFGIGAEPVVRISPTGKVFRGGGGEVIVITYAWCTESRYD